MDTFSGNETLEGSTARLEQLIQDIDRKVKPVKPEDYEYEWSLYGCDVPSSFKQWTKGFYNAALSNREDWVPLEVYATGGYSYYRTLTSAADESLPMRTSNVINDLDAAFNRYARRLPNDCLPLYRGAIIPDGQEYNLQHASNYVSTSVCLESALNFGDYPPIKIDEGQSKSTQIILIVNQLSVPCVSMTPFATLAEGEAEVLLPRYARYVLLKKPYFGTFQRHRRSGRALRLVYEVAVV